MGLGPFRGCTSVVYRDRIINLNPNPKNYKIRKLIELENTYVEVFYPDAKNYEGNKVMVYAGRVAEKLLSVDELDPHFQEKGLSPIARFAPTEEGKFMGMQIAKGYPSEYSEVEKYVENGRETIRAVRHALKPE